MATLLVQRRTVAGLLTGLTLAAFLLRLIKLDAQALWTDEAYSFHVAARPLVAQVLADHDQTPPLFVLALHFWMKVAGTSPAAVRFLSVVAGTLTVPLVFALATRFTTERGAWLASGLLALSVYPVIISEEARAFAFLMVFSTASFLALLRWQERPTSGRAAWFVAATALTLYSHMWGLFIIAAQGLYVLVSVPAQTHGKWAVVRLQLLAGALLLPWASSLLQATRRVASGFWIETPGLDDLYWTRVHVLGGPAMHYLLVVVLALAGWAFVRRWRAGRPDKKELALWLWLFVPIVVPFAASFWVPFYTPKYVIPLAVPAAILAARSLARWLPSARSFGTVAGVLLLVQAGTLGAHFLGDGALDSRQDWRGTMALVEGQALDNATALFNKGYCDSTSDRDLACAWEIEASRRDIRLVPFFFEDKGVTPAVNATSVRQVDAIAANATELWLLYSYPNDLDHLVGARLVGLGWTESGHWDFKKIEVWRYSRPGA